MLPFTSYALELQTLSKEEIAEIHDRYQLAALKADIIAIAHAGNSYSPERCKLNTHYKVVGSWDGRAKRKYSITRPAHCLEPKLFAPSIDSIHALIIKDDAVIEIVRHEIAVELNILPSKEFDYVYNKYRKLGPRK